MRKVRFLLLSLLTITLMTFAMGCEQAGSSCESDSDCSNEKEACYAGYCGENEPTGGFYLKFDLKDKNGQVGQAAMKCSEGNIDNVDVAISTHGFEVSKTTIACKDINVNEDGDLPNSNNGELINKLWPDENYDVKVTFVVKSSDNVVKDFSVRPSLGYTSEPKENNEVLLEKLVKATLAITWEIEEANGTVHTDSSSCAGLHIDTFRIAMDALEPCDAENNCDFSDYISVPCTNTWAQDFTIFEATGTSIGIYAVDYTGKSVLFQKTKAITIDQDQLDNDNIPPRKLTLEPLGNKK